MVEPISKEELKDAASDKSRIASELLRDIAKATVRGDEQEAKRLTRLRTEYLLEAAQHRKDLKLLKKSKY